ncbi:MAG: M48 family metallopeptidase [Clostridia bacterium]|nr:M48 family metallopeptidase [Clostridia bacterium]
MAIDPELLLHPSDKAALKALKAIPGFSQLVRGYMGIINERQMRIINMSSNLRLSEEQMPEVYRLLYPICEKLGIKVPELYLEMNVVPNAYTYGDTDPFIVITSGLLDNLPRDLISAVLAHECGHIACHHTLYRTIGMMIMRGFSQFVTGLASLLTVPLQVAFAYWMRCSEFSADRAAVLCEGGPDPMVRVCFAFAGCGKDYLPAANLDAFLSQAAEYKQMVADNKWNKAMEYILLSGKDHPLTAVRALECREWAASEQFLKIQSLMQYRLTDPARCDIPAPLSSGECARKKREDVEKLFTEAGFTALEFVPPYVGPNARILSALADGERSFKKGDWITRDTRIIFECREEAPSGKPAESVIGGITSDAVSAVNGLIGSLFRGRQTASAPEGIHDVPAALDLGEAAAKVACRAVPDGGAIPFDDPRKMADSIRKGLDGASGIVEVAKGVTAGGRPYIYSIVKHRIYASGGNGIRRGTEYFLELSVKNGGAAQTVSGVFREEEMGRRESEILKAWRDMPHGDDGGVWASDPYDPFWKRGYLMTRAEHAEYDAMYPDHPLSAARGLVRYIADHN